MKEEVFQDDEISFRELGPVLNQASQTKVHAR